MAKSSKAAPPAPSNVKPSAPAKSTADPVASAPAPVAATETPAPLPAAVPEATPSPTPDPVPSVTPAQASPPASAPAPTQFVRVRAGNAPVSEGGIRHDPRSEFTIPRERLPHLQDIVTFVADIPD